AKKGREVIFNKQPSICIYRLKERFSLQNDPSVGGFAMCIFGSRRNERGLSCVQRRLLIDLELQ
ncbi:hypothetical protein MKN04_20090, partial [Paenibacillus polymyxa]|uniref:hypothetical protein n=1 Tax=Paenibacillus polymyxa TaxID=1406 RepID=UPI001F133356